jgi:hypothetical protein
MKTMRILMVLLLAASLCPDTAQAGMPATWTDWKEYSAELIFIGYYQDYQGYHGSVYVSPDQWDRVWIMDHELSRASLWGKPAPRVGNGLGLMKIAPGTAGILHYWGAAEVSNQAMEPPPGTEQQPSDGTFLAFSPSSTLQDLAILVRKTKNPLLLGLLTGNPAVRPQTYTRLLALKKKSDINQALAGLCLANEFEQAGQYLAVQAQGWKDDALGEPDFRVLLPWLRQGLAASPDQAFTDDEMRASPVLFLLPAIRAWLATRSPEKTAAAYYDAIFGRAAAYVLPRESSTMPRSEGFPPPIPGPFERGEFNYAKILKHLSPELYQVLMLADQGLEHLRNIPVLDVSGQGAVRWLVLWNATTRERWAVRYADPATQTLAFGSRADFLIRLTNPGEFQRGTVIRCRFLEPDPAGLLSELQNMNPGYRLGYLAKAVQSKSAGLAWDAWREALRKAVETEGWARINNAEIFQLSLDQDVANALAAALPEMIHSRPYTEAGEQALRIVAVDLKNQDYAQARRLLAALPEALRASRTTYDSHGDIGWQNRCAIELFRILLARLSDEKTLKLSPELKKYHRYPVEIVRTILVTVPGIPVETWETLLREALKSRK